MLFRSKVIFMYMKKSQRIIFISSIVLALVAVVVVVARGQYPVSEVAPPSTGASTVLEEVHAVVYKLQSCGCCSGHVDAMQAAGISVEVIDDMDTAQIKDEHGIPEEMWSCHTTLLSRGDKEYVVEGHVPIEAIQSLLENKPDIDGIALPGMPSGTPGMPGPKMGSYDIMKIGRAHV